MENKKYVNNTMFAKSTLASGIAIKKVRKPNSQPPAFQKYTLNKLKYT